MRNADSNNDNYPSDAEKVEGNEKEDEIKILIRRKEVLNNVLEKMIDKIQQPHKP